jgi:glyoxylase-like metal-dependent hydrolase (beta-lactamase superfamily II)
VFILAAVRDSNITIPFSLSPTNDPDVNKEMRLLTTRLEGDVRICQPAAHSHEAVHLFNDHFSVVYWPWGHTDHCIVFAILV